MGTGAPGDAVLSAVGAALVWRDGTAGTGRGGVGFVVAAVLSLPPRVVSAVVAAASGPMARRIASELPGKRLKE